MSRHPTLLEHFRSFSYQNSISDLDQALEYFAVFGGTGWDVDAGKSVETLIEEKILRNYEPLHQSMIRYTHNNPVYHRVLSIIALGTEHEHDVFKKAKIGRDRGEEAIDYLEKKSLLRFDLSVEEPAKGSAGLSDRLIFRLPFMRFWFALVSAQYQSISAGDFAEFEQKWQQLKGNFSIMLSNLLVRDLVVQNISKQYADDPIVSIGTYYDQQTRIEILAKRKSGKILAGECKYSQDPAKIHMPNALKQRCEKAEIDAEAYVLFSKNGFTDEVLEMRSAEWTLFAQNDLASLLDGMSENTLLTYKNKKY
jgi:hypothetical protein